MDLIQLEEKLKRLRDELHKLETVEVEKMRIKRIYADMGDDWRENEAAKLAEQEHDVLYRRIVDTKRRIVETKKLMWAIKHVTLKK
jgi:hypothetical protein